MDDVTRALNSISPITSFLAERTIAAMEKWHVEHPLATRLRQSALTRDNYLYDEVIADAELATLPMPIRVPKSGRMRWVSALIDDIEVVLWPKKVNFRSLLTSSYPTSRAKTRQHSWTLFGVPRCVLFVFGHTILENLAGAEAWIDQLVLTQESRDSEGVRRVTFKRSLYHSNVGPIALRAEDEQTFMFDTQIATATVPVANPLPSPKVKPRVAPRRVGENSAPIVGISEARRAAEAARQAQQDRERRGNQSKDGSQGA